MSIWTKFFSMIAAVYFFTALYAQDSNLHAKHDYENHEYEDFQYNDMDAKKAYDQGHATDKELLSAYNSPGRTEVKSPWDVYLSGSYILWQAKERGLDYATSYPATSNQDIYPLNMDFDYTSGFKVSICSKFDHDAWTVVVDYTRLHLSNHEYSYARYQGYLLPTMIYYRAVDLDVHTNNRAFYTIGKWRLSYDMIDLEFGRPCYVGTCLTFKPHVGARGGWIEQKYHSIGLFTHLEENQGDTLIQADSRARTNTWLIGPRVSIDSNWLLGLGFKLQGNVAAGVTYQYFKTTFKQDNFHQPVLLNINAKDKIGYVTPNFDLALGLAWGSYFANHNWHVEFSFLYDFLYFWSQNTMRQFSDKCLRRIETKAANLVLHGMNLSLRFDF